MQRSQRKQPAYVLNIKSNAYHIFDFARYFLSCLVSQIQKLNDVLYCIIFVNNMKKITSYPKEKIKILLLENISVKAKQQFQQAGYSNITIVKNALSEKELIKEIKQVHLLGLRSKTQLTPKVFNAAKKLLAAGCYCIGTNQVNMPTAIEHGIAIFNAPFSNTRSVAELVIGSSIMLLRRIPEKNKAAHAGIWLKEAERSYELRGKKIGIIGYGNIGMQVGVLAEALGMEVLYFDIEGKLPLGNAKQMPSIKSLLEGAHIVSLHVPENGATKNLIGKNELSQMQKGSLLINYSRGNVVDIEALTRTLKNNHLGGAAIDVFPDEPEKAGAPFISSLQELPNVILTPHIGGSTEEAQVNIGEDVTFKLLNFLEKGITTGSHSVPALNLPATPNTHRILHIHKNIPGVLSQINKKLASQKINILGQYLKTNESIGYVVLDVDKNLSAEAFRVIKEVKGSIKSRMLW